MPNIKNYYKIKYSDLNLLFEKVKMLKYIKKNNNQKSYLSK